MKLCASVNRFVFMTVAAIFFACLLSIGMPAREVLADEVIGAPIIWTRVSNGLIYKLTDESKHIVRFPGDHTITITALEGTQVHQATNSGYIYQTCDFIDGSENITTSSVGSYGTWSITNARLEDHSWAWSTDSPATCTTAEVGHYYCSKCGFAKNQEVRGGPLGHAWGGAWESSRTNPTCTDSGVIYYHHSCVRCGAIEACGTSPLAALGHDWRTATLSANKGLRTAATCTAPATYYKYCARNAGHFDANQWNTVGTDLGHIWDSGTVIKEPTVYDNGIRRFSCTRDRTHKIDRVEPHNCFNIWCSGKQITKICIGDQLIYGTAVGNKSNVIDGGNAPTPGAHDTT